MQTYLRSKDRYAGQKRDIENLQTNIACKP